MDQNGLLLYENGPRNLFENNAMYFRFQIFHTIKYIWYSWNNWNLQITLSFRESFVWEPVVLTAS